MSLIAQSVSATGTADQQSSLPSELYAQYIQQHGLQTHPRQQAILVYFDHLQQSLYRQWAQPSRWWERIWRRRTTAAAHGIYLYGGVGQGKTLLMDLFYNSLPQAKVQRQHFHHFMLNIHQRLKQTGRDPLPKIADDIASATPVLCLDEFYVNDITDAMLLAGLLRALFANGVCLITTSNCAPDTLYRNGLQRERFLPAIDLLNTTLTVLNLDTGIDYRLQTLREDGTYHHPLDAHAAAHMQHAFNALCSHTCWQAHSIEILGRQIPVLGQAEGAVWFEFDTLCRSARSQADYLEIAREHHSVFISGIPALTATDDDAARRFLHLIDVLYEHRVKLIASAAVSIEELYSGQRLMFEFQRATSRLLEMQSEHYLAEAHRP